MATEACDLRYEEEYVLNSRGMKLFTCRWIPANREPKALIFICHGYAMECSITMSSTAVRLAKAGYAVYGIDYEGHGKSQGLQADIRNFGDVVDDVSDHYTKICEEEENRDKMRFLLGESMGGAVLLLLHRKKPDFWDGAVLVAPMCKIAEEMKPHPVVITVLKKLCSIIPTWKLVPDGGIIDVAFKQPEIRRQIRENPYCYKGRIRLRTANELLGASLELEKRLQEVSLPFLVLHGGEDRVTDKAVSEQLYQQASSSDKTFKMYPGMWHGLLYAETPENIDTVFGDIIRWMDERASPANPIAEIERKSRNDGVFKLSQ